MEHLEVAMAEVSSTEVSKNFSTYREMADGSRGAPEPVLVLHYNKPSVVIVAAEEYARLKRRDRVVGATEDLPEWLARQIAQTEMDPRFNDLDDDN
jgi:PHD/YefM family antitoxin component YafN of YafNO toxin-antitoxin module